MVDDSLVSIVGCHGCLSVTLFSMSLATRCTDRWFFFAVSFHSLSLRLEMVCFVHGCSLHLLVAPVRCRLLARVLSEAIML